MFTVLFGIPRTAGWLAQSQEMIPDAEQTIARPRQVYTGYDVRQFVPIAKRVQVATSAALIGLGLEVVGKKSQDSESREQLLAASLLGRGRISSRIHAMPLLGSLGGQGRQILTSLRRGIDHLHLLPVVRKLAAAFQTNHVRSS